MLRRFSLMMLLIALSFLATQTRGDAPAGNQVDLPLDLPKPAYKETPKNIPAGLKVEKPRVGPRPAFMVPKGVVNLALKKKVTSSESDPVIGSLDLITDGDKEATEGSYVELGRGVQWIKIDLEKEYPISAVVIWHYHGQARVYHSVVVQASSDPDFKKDVVTLFNNDDDNSCGQGVGTDIGYWEGFEGRIVDGKNTKARYVRLFSNGNTSDDDNHYTEVEVWGLKS